MAKISTATESKDNMQTQVCNQCLIFNVPKCCRLAN